MIKIVILKIIAFCFVAVCWGLKYPRSGEEKKITKFRTTKSSEWKIAGGNKHREAAQKRTNKTCSLEVRCGFFPVIYGQFLGEGAKKRAPSPCNHSKLSRASNLLDSRRSPDLKVTQNSLSLISMRLIASIRNHSATVTRWRLFLLGVFKWSYPRRGSLCACVRVAWKCPIIL